MHCRHCGMSATRKGQDMSIETFRNAIKYDTESITIGGGEPTIHPLFWQFVVEAIASGCENIWLATNGSQTTTALALANMARKGVIGVALSQDPYHDPISNTVVEAFTIKNPPTNSFFSPNKEDDKREIRNVSNRLIRAGRCKEGKKGCICDEIVIKPDGTVKGCGCPKSPIMGNVNTSFEVPDDWEYDICYKKQPKNKKRKLNEKEAG